MATQTGWDLWGTPDSNGGFTLSPSPPKRQCGCELQLKQLKEWKREHEKQAEADRNLCKTKMNVLKQKLMQSEDDRAKMKVKIGALSTQIVNNTAAIAEMRTQRAEGRGLPGGDMARRATNGPQNRAGAVNNSKGSAQGNKPNDRQATQSPTCSEGQVALTSDLRSMRQITLFQSPVARQTNTTAPAKAVSSASASGSNGPGNRQGGRPNVNKPQSKGGAAVTSTKSNQPSKQQMPLGKSGPANGGSSNRVPYTAQPKQASTRPFGTGSSARPPPTSRSVSTSTPSTPVNITRQSAADSWAEDPVSDAEIMAVVDASDSYPNTRSRNIGAGDVTDSRISILRDAINETVQKSARAKQVNPSDTGSPSTSVVGNKRGYEGLSDGEDPEDAADTYADVAANGVWEDPANKRRRRGPSGDRVPDLFGVRQEPQRDIFV